MNENTDNAPTAPRHFGDLPAWGQADLPEPLPWSFRNVIHTIGPGAILLAGSIGGGEWLVGPAMAVEYGTSIFWVATLAIVFQVLFNLEAIRYTLYTGEPVLTGIMRLKPGSKFWATVYSLLAGAQLGVPALAAGCSGVLFATFANRLPGDDDTGVKLWITFGIMGVTVLILMFGGTIERMLELASWGMIAYIFIFLVVVNVAFVSAEGWLHTLSGFLQFGRVPKDAKLSKFIPLLAALAATAGSGGIGNLSITNWVRDKGMGMGGLVGAIPSAVGSRQIQLSHVGKVFPTTRENLRRWQLWWKYVVVDQVWLWAAGCFLGMFLNVNLASQIIPPGTNISGPAAGAYQAQYMADHLWSGFWMLALLNGFWIFYSTHLSNTDALVRTVTDILWVASDRVRTWRGGSIRTVYYGLLFLFTAWGAIAVNWGHAMQLFTTIASIAGFVLAFAAVQILIVNTRLLPPEIRPPLWRRAALVGCALFYGFLSAATIWAKVTDA